VLADARGKTVVAEVAEDDPEFEAAQAAAELDAVLGVISDRLAPLVERAEVFRHEREGAV
jgi:hypothetical protein